ncbi:hypothetical protein BJF85_07040 [Saccharomonospora sp. CUA-673]|uniref:hypothetical protein n=1 Tax=Saccharomonospora sp. CUA-673 TaxID=1904969 RepID=UPI0009665452|nr:hypothetical protein [Saccharomonospora sp. CUA-673]OLT40058.1 hypothetical protein BJF85_07040 [Saccharomonospora sp. CUA-673]
MSRPDPRPFQRFEDRLAGKPLDDVLLEGVPDHLEQPLRDWLYAVLRDNSVSNRPREALAADALLILQWPNKAAYGPVTTLVGCAQEDLLAAIDAVLYLDPDNPWSSLISPQDIDELDRKLLYGRSAYRVDDSRGGLVARVDPTVEEAYRGAVDNAEKTAAELLRSAWHHVYKPNPTATDATTAYREAVRAVEEVACPLVLPNSPKPTLGTVIAHLRDAEHKWETVLVGKDGDPGGPQPVRELMERLWNGQVSRHGGSKQSRDQDQAESEAAVHTAVLLVQWLSTGVLRKADA